MKIMIHSSHFLENLVELLLKYEICADIEKNDSIIIVHMLHETEIKLTYQK